MIWGVELELRFFNKKREKVFIYLSVSVHVSRGFPCIALASRSTTGHGRAAQATYTRAPHMAGCCFRFGLASLPMQATRDPNSCVPLARPFVKRGRMMGHPRGIMWDAFDNSSGTYSNPRPPKHAMSYVLLGPHAISRAGSYCEKLLRWKHWWVAVGR